jgi:transcriptional regulator with XRE-family HTH domain
MNSDASKPTLANTMRQAREAAGLSVRQLAPLVGAHHSVLARIEAGDTTRPTPELLQRIAEALKIDVAELLAFIGVKSPEPKTYFRKAYGLTPEQADEAAERMEQIVRELRDHQNNNKSRGGNQP